MSDKCFECSKPASYIRHTQFAGNHYYCEEHAKRESDFGVDDDCTYWTKSIDNDINTDVKSTNAEEAPPERKCPLRCCPSGKMTHPRCPVKLTLGIIALKEREKNASKENDNSGVC